MGWGEKRWKINWAASTGDGKSGGGQVCYFYVLLLTAHGGSGPNRGQSGVGQGGEAGIPLMVTDNYYGHRYPMDPGYLVLSSKDGLDLHSSNSRGESRGLSNPITVPHMEVFKPFRQWQSVEVCGNL